MVRQVVFDFRIGDGRKAPVDKVNLFGHHIYGNHMIVLREQNGEGEANVAGTRNCNVHPTLLELGKWIKRFDFLTIANYTEVEEGLSTKTLCRGHREGESGDDLPL